MGFGESFHIDGSAIREGGDRGRSLSIEVGRAGSVVKGGDDKGGATEPSLRVQFGMIGNAVCPPLIAALAGAVLGQCSTARLIGPNVDKYSEAEWVTRGRSAALALALEAVAPTRRARVLQRAVDAATPTVNGV